MCLHYSLYLCILDKFLPHLSCVCLGITPLGDGTAQVNCDCSLPGYVVVYLVQERTNKPLLEMVETFPFDKRIQFRYSMCTFHIFKKKS